MGATSEELVIEYDYEFATFGEGDSRITVSTAYVGDDISSDRHSVTIKGPCQYGEMKAGLTYRLLGRWITHDKHGLQFVFSTFMLKQPASRRGIIRYLCQAPHVGPATAEALWTTFGADAVRMLREDPAKAASTIGRFTHANAMKAAEWLEEQRAIEGSSIDLFALLDGRGFPKTVIKDAIQKWGTKAAWFIEQNPYLLSFNFPGVGFLKADRLYKDLGKNLNRKKRQTMCIAHDLSTDRDGHTWFPAERCRSILKDKIDSAEISVVPALKLGIRGGLLKTCRDTDGQVWVADAGRAANEAYIAEALGESFEETPAWPDVLEDDFLSIHQRGKICEATKGTIGFLGGSPGTGKTTAAGRIIRMFAKEYGIDSIAAAAPTGKAAVRLTESLSRAGVSIDAKTIHRTLGVKSAKDGWSFEHDESNPLPYKLIVLDEMSMADTNLAASVFRARGRDTHLLGLGDVEQLPPIGHGAPLRDIITSGVPYGELTEIRRNSGRIVKACKQIREEGRFDPSPALDLAADDPENLLHINKWKPELQMMELEAILNRIAAKKVYDPKWHVQVLCAVNKKSPLARKTLNERLQGLLNPNGEQAQGNPFRVGDKIICLKNYWAICEDKNDELANDDGKVLVCNGEMAEVLKVEPNLMVAELQMPHRVVRIPRGKQEQTEGDGKGGENDEASDTGCQWDLAFAISCHKSQGSSWPITIVLGDEYPGALRICSRQWLYTGISRAEKLCILIGSKKTFGGMCERDAISNRKTFLREQIETRREAVVA